MKNIEQKVIKFIDEKSLIDKNDRILVALSGGPDSVFLLHFLIKFKKRFKIEIGVLHINHSLRGKDADDDEEFCKNIAESFNVQYFTVKKDVRAFAEEKRISVEQSGRILRYRELENFAIKYNYNKIATAHNSNDNTETVLLNLIKGAGIRGISGIPYKRGNIIRPIIVLTKDDVLQYLKIHSIFFRVDISNFSNDFERNFLRNEIIPEIKKRLNPSFEDTIFSSSEIFKNLSSSLETEIDEIIEDVVEFSENKLLIFESKLDELMPEIKWELIKTALERNFSVQISFNDIHNLLTLLNKESGKKVNLSNNLTAFRERGEIKIFANLTIEEFEPVNLKTGESININGKKIAIIAKSFIPENYSGTGFREVISADNIEENFVLRRWKAGDKFYPLGMKGAKKISDFLNEQKIPSSEKYKQLVLTNNNKIVWVVGLRLDERFKITQNTNKVYELCLK